MHQCTECEGNMTPTEYQEQNGVCRGCQGIDVRWLIY